MSEMPGDTKYDNANLTWAEWPEHVPRPTQDEWNAAEVRFRRETDNNTARLKAEGLPPYMGDTGYSLSFDMATCSIGVWWHLFFPGGRDANGKQCGWKPHTGVSP